jgi:hypothetical protein
MPCASMAVRSKTTLIFPLLLGCSTADGLDTGAGDTGGPPVDPPPQPLADGDACGLEAYGWPTDCEVIGQISYENPLAPGQYLEIDPFFGPTDACCEGRPLQAVADAACVQSCTKQLCDMADNIYDQIAAENGWHCALGCTFDLDGCMAGIPVQQFPHPPLGDDYPHEVTVSCEATNVEPRNPDGTFAFIELPVNSTYLDPEPCGSMPEGTVVNALGSLVANSAHEDAGTYAFATWWLGTEQGQQGTSDVAAELAYAVRPCDGGECLDLTRMHASVPAGPYGGLTVQSAELSLVAVAAQPAIDRKGGFEFPPGSLHFILGATVGELPLAITRTNATATRGRVSHAADLFELTDLRLAYEDSDFGAELRIDLVASHINRAPQAAIRRLDSPLDCDEPVVLEAASMDPDDDPMQHYWWTPVGMFQAPTAELALRPGAHFVVLVSVDHHGAHDATSLTYQRSCA